MEYAVAFLFMVALFQSIVIQAILKDTSKDKERIEKLEWQVNCRKSIDKSNK